MVDDKEVGKLYFGQKSTIYLHPGQRVIKMYVNDSYPLVPIILKLNTDWENSIQVNKGETIFFKLKHYAGEYVVLGKAEKGSADSP